jgi:hypothetical protein
MGLQAYALAAEGMVSAYAHLTGQEWKPYEVPVSADRSTSRVSAVAQMAVLADGPRGSSGSRFCHWCRMSICPTARSSHVPFTKKQKGIFVKVAVFVRGIESTRRQRWPSAHRRQCRCACCRGQVPDQGFPRPCWRSLVLVMMMVASMVSSFAKTALLSPQSSAGVVGFVEV